MHCTDTGNPTESNVTRQRISPTHRACAHPLSSCAAGWIGRGAWRFDSMRLVVSREKRLHRGHPAHHTPVTPRQYLAPFPPGPDNQYNAYNRLKAQTRSAVHFPGSKIILQIRLKWWSHLRVELHVHGQLQRREGCSRGQVEGCEEICSPSGR